MTCAFADYVCSCEDLLPALRVCDTLFRFMADCSEELLQRSLRAMKHYDRFSERITGILTSLRFRKLREDLSLDNVIASVIQLGPACHSLVKAHPSLTNGLCGFTSALLWFHTTPPATIHNRRSRHVSWDEEIAEVQVALSKLCKIYEIPAPQSYLLLSENDVIPRSPHALSSQHATNEDVDNPSGLEGEVTDIGTITAGTDSPSPAKDSR